MIRSFNDNETEKIYKQVYSKKLPSNIQKKALLKLMFIDAAESEKDLLIPPGNKFEHLIGKKKGICSIRINKQWRICFKLKNGDAFNVSIEDYH